MSSQHTAACAYESVAAVSVPQFGFYDIEQTKIRLLNNSVCVVLLMLVNVMQRLDFTTDALSVVTGNSFYSGGKYMSSGKIHFSVIASRCEYSRFNLISQFFSFNG